MQYNFDEVIDRNDNYSQKWDKYKGKDILPLWVADMDFRVAQPIQESLSKITNHAVYGYAQVPEELENLVVKRLKERHNWEIKKEWLVWLPGLVPGIYASCRAVGKDGDAVMTATPVYRPFTDGPINSNRQVQMIPMLVDENGYHTFDFEKMEQSITPETKMFLLCNPHNPNGRVFSSEELQKLLDICLAHNIIICSDEIHCDLILDKTKQHISIASMSKAAEDQTITLLAPSKTFNIAGLGCSFAVIPNDELRANFIKVKTGIMPHPSAYSYEAALVAYRDGQEWHEQMLDYLRDCHEYLVKEVNQIDGLSMARLEATYLAWIKIKNSEKINNSNVSEYFENIGLGIIPASVFNGNGYFRLNFGTRKAILEEAVRRLRKINVGM